MTTWDRYKSLTTGLELRSRTGNTIYPRSYCDHESTVLYIAKPPACKLDLSPVVQFPNTNIAWDISQSVSPTSTIDSFDIAWGGTTDIGDLTSQDWQSDPLSGNVQYTTAGIYTVTASVTDLIPTESKEVKITVNIVDYVALQRVYIGTTDSGLFILTPSGLSQSNSGLTGNHTSFRAIKLHPAYKDLPPGQQHIWACTQDGLAYSTNGADTWTVIGKASLGTPANDAGDSPAPAATDLELVDLAFDPQDPRRVYLVGRTTSPNLRTWLYWSDNYGDDWSNEQVGA